MYFLERVAKPGWRWPAKPRPPEHHKNKHGHNGNKKVIEKPRILVTVYQEFSLLQLNNVYKNNELSLKEEDKTLYNQNKLINGLWLRYFFNWPLFLSFLCFLFATKMHILLQVIYLRLLLLVCYFWTHKSKASSCVNNLTTI